MVGLAPGLAGDRHQPVLDLLRGKLTPDYYWPGSQVAAHTFTNSAGSKYFARDGTSGTYPSEISPWGVTLRTRSWAPLYRGSEWWRGVAMLRSSTTSTSHWPSRVR